MIGTNSFFYIMDYSGNYYRTNKSDQLVVASGREEAEIFTLQDANSRTSVGKKSHFYLISPVEEREEATSNEQMNLVEEITDVTPNEQMNSAEDTAEPTLLHEFADQIADETDYIEESRSQDTQKLTPIQNITSQEMDEQPEKNINSYELENLDWEEYIEHFIYTSEAVKNYKEELNQELSDIDKKICDVLHFIELCETSDTEAIDLVELLRICRENRREIKDEITKAEAFQKNVGISSNVAKAKQALKIIKGLGNRKYKPRKYKELFENCNVKISNHNMQGKDLMKQPEVQKGCEQDMLEERRESEERKETPFDNKEINWIEFVRMQTELYSNVQQYMINLQLDIDKITQQINDILYNIEDSKYNVTEGYKVYKDLRNLKQLQKQKEHELDLLYNMTMYIDCQNMADICKENLEEMGKIDLTETMKISA